MPSRLITASNRNRNSGQAAWEPLNSGGLAMSRRFSNFAPRSSSSFFFLDESSSTSALMLVASLAVRAYAP
eukprot:15688682-Heterocapsa_arctica.AAC.1